MTVAFNHAIIAARDRHVSASFFAGLFGLPEPVHAVPFSLVLLGGGVHLLFAEPGVEDIQMQHDGFLVDDRTFDEVYERLTADHIEHWADPQARLPGQTNTHHGGRGVYFMDPAGHGFEVLTRPDPLTLVAGEV